MHGLIMENGAYYGEYMGLLWRMGLIMEKAWANYGEKGLIMEKIGLIMEKRAHYGEKPRVFYIRELSSH